jgi:hypothetical protein
MTTMQILMQSLLLLFLLLQIWTTRSPCNSTVDLMSSARNFQSLFTTLFSKLHYFCTILNTSGNSVKKFSKTATKNFTTILSALLDLLNTDKLNNEKETDIFSNAVYKPRYISAIQSVF